MIGKAEPYRTATAAKPRSDQPIGNPKAKIGNLFIHL
jgi:hypothetical protein